MAVWKGKTAEWAARSAAASEPAAAASAASARTTAEAAADTKARREKVKISSAGAVPLEAAVRSANRDVLATQLVAAEKRRRSGAPLRLERP